MAFDSSTAQLAAPQRSSARVMDMAYGNNTPTDMTLAHVTRQVHRLSRGFPYQRFGARQIVYQVPSTPVAMKNVVSSSNVLPPYPQFKTHYIYSPAAGQVQNQFQQQLVQNTRVRWPSGPLRTTTTGL